MAAETQDTNESIIEKEDFSKMPLSQRNSGEIVPETTTTQRFSKDTNFSLQSTFRTCIRTPRPSGSTRSKLPNRSGPKSQQKTNEQIMYNMENQNIKKRNNNKAKSELEKLELGGNDYFIETSQRNKSTNPLGVDLSQAYRNVFGVNFISNFDNNNNFDCNSNEDL